MKLVSMKRDYAQMNYSLNMLLIFSEYLNQPPFLVFKGGGPYSPDGGPGGLYCDEPEVF